MAENGRTTLGRRRHWVEVDTDPNVTAVNALAGSIINHGAKQYRKLTDGLNTDLEPMGGQVQAVTQAAHGFVAKDEIRLTGSGYTKAQANSAENALVVGVVIEVIDANNFLYQEDGIVRGIYSGQVAGETHRLSATSAGATFNGDPVVILTTGQYDKPVFVSRNATDSERLSWPSVEVPAALPDSNVPGRKKGTGSGSGVALTPADQREIIGIEVAASGTTLVAVSATVILATITGLTSLQAVWPTVRMIDAIAGFDVYPGDPDSDPSSDQARFSASPTAVAGEQAIRIRHKDSGSVARTFRWIIYKTTVTS